MAAPKGNKNAVGNKGNRYGTGVPKIYTKEFIENEAIEFVKWAQTFPSGKPLFFKRFALDRGYSPQRFSEWEKESKLFSEALNVVRQYQEANWLENAMIGNFNANFTKFCIAHHHKYEDKISVSAAADFLANVIDYSKAKKVNDD